MNQKKVSICLSSLKSKVDQLDFDKLKAVPVDFKKSSYVVEKEAVKKIIYNKLAKNVNTINNCEPIKKNRL